MDTKEVRTTSNLRVLALLSAIMLGTLKLPLWPLQASEGSGGGQRIAESRAQCNDSAVRETVPEGRPPDSRIGQCLRRGSSSGPPSAAALNPRFPQAPRARGQSGGTPGDAARQGATPPAPSTRCDLCR